ncbi:MAG: acetyl-CoA carboxylase biotin carboxylase subunit [Nitrospirota bacterium]
MAGLFKKVLIANRGEIALRIIRSCRDLGIQTVVAYSEADAESLSVRLADERVCIGPADAALSYRNIPNILSAAEITGAEAIHPGYGFLAENAQFAEACDAAGLKFIGPSPESIALMGDKAQARELMTKHNIPVIPGSTGAVKDEQEARETAKRIGYPVIVKAAAGGGGRGMRVVNQEDDLTKALQTAQMEAKTSFGDESVYLEKYFIDPRHIEVQILADKKGNTLALGERDCSIQRRHQKLVEESPSPAVSPELRREMMRVAVDAAKAAKYVNTGTVEFLLDKHQKFYFIEMNTRIQVEHPVTEMVVDMDLIKEQIMVAAGRPLAIKQRDVKLRGHAIECRINAECPERFTPSPGTISVYRVPGGPGVRVDSAAYPGCVIPPYYDSLVAKLIVHADTRAEAIARMKRALAEFEIQGIKTTIPLHRRIMDDPGFVKGKFSTGFLERFLSADEPAAQDSFEYS